jgi:hypothetical protein
MYVIAYLWTDSLQIWWEHITGHHHLQGLRTFHVNASHAHVCISLSLDGLKSKLSRNILQSITRCMTYYYVSECIILVLHVTARASVPSHIVHRIVPNHCHPSTGKD